MHQAAGALFQPDFEVKVFRHLDRSSFSTAILDSLPILPKF
jgi:hypothetical protein